MGGPSCPEPDSDRVNWSGTDQLAQMRRNDCIAMRYLSAAELSRLILWDVSMHSTVASLLAYTPRPIHRAALRCGRQVREIVRTLLKHRTRACAVIVKDSAGRVLLVRHSYQEPDEWMLPGGSIGKREKPLVAARREVIEEVDCRLMHARLIDFESCDHCGVFPEETFIFVGVTNCLGSD